MSARRRPRRGQRGAAAIEMAVILPLLAVLGFGVMDMGRVLFTNIAIQGAAQEGAIYGSFRPHDLGAVRQRVVESLGSPTLRPGDVSVSCPGSEEIRVVVTHEVDLLTPMVSEWFGGSYRIRRAVTGHVFSEVSCGG